MKKSHSLMGTGFLEVMTVFWSQMMAMVAQCSEYTKSR